MDEARLALMLARDELHQLVNAYCRAVDRADYEALRGLYHPDATDSHGSFSTGGVEQFIAQLQAAEPYVLVSQHNITTTNFVIDGETGRGEIYCLVFHTFSGPKHDIDVIIGGRYLDNYTKHDGRWKFSQRTIVADWAYQNDPSQSFVLPTIGSTVGLRLPIDGSVIAFGFMGGLMVLGAIIGANLWQRSRRKYLIAVGAEGITIDGQRDAPNSLQMQTLRPFAVA